MLKPSLQLKLSQQLTMTPQLQQAIRLLQLPIMELQTQIQTALDENVMLEVEEPETLGRETAGGRHGRRRFATSPRTSPRPTPTTPSPRSPSPREADWEDTQKTGPSEAPKSADPRTTFEYADRSEETLRDHLLWQLELENLDARTTAIGQADHRRDQRRRLSHRRPRDDPRDARAGRARRRSRKSSRCSSSSCSSSTPSASAHARSANACCCSSGSSRPTRRASSSRERIAAEHLPLVAEHQYGALKRLLRASDGEIEAAIALVRACQPRPGRRCVRGAGRVRRARRVRAAPRGPMGRRAQQLDVAARCA